MKKNQVNSSTIEGWKNKLLKDHEVSSMDDLPAEILEEELKQVKGMIVNCSVWDDPEGIAMNERYRVVLEEVLNQKKHMKLKDYVAEELLQKLPEYAVEITETFQKTVKVKAGSESEALEIVRRKYFADEIILTVDDDFVDTDFKVLGDKKC